MTFTSLYIHIPFCVHRCGYCDFNTYTGVLKLIPEYSTALSKEIEHISRTSVEQHTIHTIYFGGGTPSLLPPVNLRAILNTVKDNFNCSPMLEITLEANPGTVSADYFIQLNAMGVNRLSLGMQSAHHDELTMLERQHSYQDVVNAVKWAREAGIDNLNLDLIFGLPTQNLPAWLNSLDAALSLNPEHLSLYALTLEPGTPMHHKVAAGILEEPDADLAADMYEAASERLKDSGFIQYEISNWANNNNNGQTNSCQHNIQYWRSLSYFGVGAGAHGFVNHYRTVNVANPRGYINAMLQDSIPSNMGGEFPHTPATAQMTFINVDTEIGEFMMMGLRMVVEGISNCEFQDRFGIRLQDKFTPQIDRLITLGLLEWARSGDERLRLTSKGRLLGNQVFKEFI